MILSSAERGLALGRVTGSLPEGHYSTVYPFVGEHLAVSLDGELLRDAGIDPTDGAPFVAEISHGAQSAEEIQPVPLRSIGSTATAHA